MDIADGIVVEMASRDAGTLRSLADLRITIFRDWPYLYEGNMAYEMDYLAEFLSDPEAVLITASASGTIVGMATASRLSSQTPDMSAPLVRAGFGIEDSFYFGESVLLPQFRGRSVGHAFFDQREAAARSAGATSSAFCAVVRADDHPLRPPKARDLHPFWRKRGYSPVEGALTSIEWKDRGASVSTSHPMQFWARRL